MKKLKILQIIFIIAFLFFLSTALTIAVYPPQEQPAPMNDDPRPKQELSVEEFISLASQNDTYFEEILIEQLKLAYRKNLLLPAGDIVLDVKGQYNIMLDPTNQDPELDMSLSKLFPLTGTSLETSYQSAAPSRSQDRTSEFNVLISQPIAQNAFGNATRLLDQIIGLENDIMRFQIVEAYEDYLASLISLYYDWYSAYENLKIGQTSYEQNLELLNEMEQRAHHNIALPVDVNKVNLLVVDKKHNLVALEQEYDAILELIYKAVRHHGNEKLIPLNPSTFHSFDIDFEKKYLEFTQTSRTYHILGLLEEKSSLEVKRNTDALLPSTNLFIGFKTQGDDWEIQNKDQLVYAGLSFLWSIGNQVEQAKLETSKIDDQQTLLSNQNKYLQLFVNLKNLSREIQKERNIILLLEQKILLSESILTDEAKNYSYGKISLNDYIQAVNLVDQSKFSKILHTVELKKLLLEWLRMTDQLVTEKILDRPLQK